MITYGFDIYGKIFRCIATVNFRYKTRKSISPAASPRSADCRQYNNRNLHALYGNHLNQVSGYVVCVPRENECPQHVWKEKERERLCACVHIWDMHTRAYTRGRGPIKSNVIVVTVPVCFFPMLFPYLLRKKPRKPKNPISIQS